jgi:penicillin amidase
MSGFISAVLQISGFFLFVAFFIQYYSDRKGLEYGPGVNVGSKMYKDENGVPHIKAESLADAYYTEGFVHAEDRLWQMFFSYKVGIGQVSELFGKDALPLDKFSRLLGLEEVCMNALRMLTIEEYESLQSYANGVNHFIKTTNILPFEFVLFGINKTNFLWQPVYSCIVTQLVQYYLTFDFYQELLRTFFFEQGILEKEVIEKIFPFRYDLFEYQRTIIKTDEMKNHKVNKKPITINEEEQPEIIVNPKQINLSSGENEDDQEEPKEINKYINKDLGIGSNNFVISGKHTENGHPYVCNDPHLQNAIPTVWYFINMIIKNNGKTYQIIGASIPGVPAVFIGTNSYVAWGITNGMVDTADIIRVEKSKFNQSLSLFFNEEERQLEKSPHLNIVKRQEVFYLNTARTKPVLIDFYDSEIGPVLNGHSQSLFIVSGKHIPKENFDEDKYFYILRASILNKKDTTLKFFFKILEIEDNDSFRAVMPYLSLCLNIVYSDRKDNIGYQLTGKIPIKSGELEGAYIKTITKPEDVKVQYIPFEDLPHLENPERGYIVTSNNIVIDIDYKHRMQGGFILDSRAVALENEIVRLITNGEKINASLINEHLLKNVKDYYCKDTLQLIYTLFENEKSVDQLNRPENSLLKNLFYFDCEMKGESRDALLFNVWENEIHHNLHYTKNIEKFLTESKIRLIEADERSNYLTYKLKQYIKNPTLCVDEYKMSCSEFFLKNFQYALETIESHLGKNRDEWKWMDLNVKHYPHKPFSLIPGLRLLGHRSVKSDGNARTPKISIPNYYDKKFFGKISSNLKFIINLNDYVNQTFFSIDTGQSGRIFHRHYDDLLVNHERGILVKLDPIIREEKFTLEFQKGKFK